MSSSHFWVIVIHEPHTHTHIQTQWLINYSLEISIFKYKMKKSSFFRFIPLSFNISDHKPTVGQIGFHARSMQSRTQVWTHLYFCLNVVDENHTKLEYCGYVVLTDILINLSTNQQTMCFFVPPPVPMSPLSLDGTCQTKKQAMFVLHIYSISQWTHSIRTESSLILYLHLHLSMFITYSDCVYSY